MARELCMIVLILAAATAIGCSSAQKVHIVGDSLGWTTNLPSGSVNYYSSWAANQTFTVGDILVFNFVTGQHDVANVTKAAYDSCSTTSATSVQSTGPANVTLHQSGEQYFICTIGSGAHCNAGQKLGINVSAASSPSPTPAPGPTVPTPTPTPKRTPTSAPASPPPAPTTPSPTGSPVTPSTPSPTGSTVTPTTPQSSPPPPSSATSLKVAGLSAAVWAIALVLLN